ncbi:hypothetical protein DXG01_006736 [Tephrocybe rancida]|nr:hypothetical protein DXG01_006736 [Tephrocybe rancida]
MSWPLQLPPYAAQPRTTVPLPMTTSAFTNKEFQHPSVAPIWRYIRKLQLSPAGSWLKDELCNAMPCWESLLPKFPPQVIANPVVPFAWHALHAIAKYLSEVCDFAQSPLPAPVWYIMPDQCPYLVHMLLPHAFTSQAHCHQPLMRSTQS